MGEFHPAFPSKYENKIKKFFEYDTCKLATYSKEVKTLSDIFINKKIKPEYFSRFELLRAYSFFYFPQNYIKTKYLLSLVSSILNKKGEINILDFGGGPGNSTLALRDFIKNKKYKIYYIDKQKEGYEFLRYLDSDDNIIKASLNDINEKIDIVVFSYTIKELGKEIIKILKSFKKYENEETLYIFIDAPDPEVLKILDKIKKGFINNGYNIIYPCRSFNCPVLKLKPEERTCYTQIDWEIPKTVSEINKKLLFRIKYLKFSSLIVSKNISSDDYLFAISPYIGEKGKGKVFFCHRKGRIAVELLKKEISENNKEFINIRRGDRVKIENIDLTKDKIRLSKETEVKRLSDIVRM